MNTEGNSNTIHGCPDCGKSLSSCRFGSGRKVPCHILRKLAKKTDVLYEALWRDENLMPDDVHTYVRDKLEKIKYTHNQGKYRHDVIVMAISYIIYDDYAPDSEITVDEMFELEDSTYGVYELSEEIRGMSRKIKGYE